MTETIFVLQWKLYGCKLPIQGIKLSIYPHFLSHILQARETFGRFGVERVWVVDTKARLVTIFRRNDLPQTVKADGAIGDSLLPGLVLPVGRLFSKTAQGN